jgi:hypothetical protein
MYNNFEHLLEDVYKSKNNDDYCSFMEEPTFATINSNGEQCWIVKVDNWKDERGYDEEEITICDILLYLANRGAE